MASENSALPAVKAFFEEHIDIEFVRWQYIDVTALVRTRVTTVRNTLQLASQGRTISVASPAANAFLLDGGFNEVYAGKKDSLVPDWSTLTRCYYAPKHASVLCFIDEPDQNFGTCPRSLLKRIEASIKEKHDMTFKVGVEVEFFLTESPASTSPVKDVHAYCSTASLRTPYLTVLEDSVRCIEKAKIPVWTFHSELRAGLFELQTEPLTPLAAADALVYINETIRAISVKHGFHATLHPHPFDNTHGVGQHLHISLSSRSDKDDSFLAGVLDSVPGISAITMPNYDSYSRRDFAGGDWVTWDLENRRSSIRKIDRAYWEIRFVDCTANNYLALACILGTGMAAWERGDALTVKAARGLGSEALDEKTRNELGVKKRAPSSLKEAIEAFSQDEAVLSVLGKELRDRFTRYKTNEEAMLAGLTLPQRRELCMALF